MSQFGDFCAGLLGGVPAALGPPAVSYIGRAGSTSNLTTYTFSSQSIGAAAGDRLVVVAIQGRAVAARTVASVTIGGNAAAIDSVSNASTDQFTTFAYLAVPAGTTADIVVTMSAGATECNIAVWRVTGLNSMTPIDSDTVFAASNPSVTIDTLADGVLIAAELNAWSQSTTWTGPTEDFDTSGESTTRVSGASMITAGSSQSAAAAVSNFARLSAISFR